MNSSSVFAVMIRSSRNFFARSKSAFWMSRSSFSMCAAAPASGMPNCFPSLPGTSRRATAQALFSMSFGPISTRTGTPRTSYSAYRNPGCLSNIVSIFTVIGS